MNPKNYHTSTAEHARLKESSKRQANWQRWGTYLSERQWGTVREDYSDNQEAWFFLPHDHARSRAYRWGEDGLMGLCDRQGRLCFSFAFWNTRDPILKERLYGLSGPEGNHGEDVKETYFYLDATPTCSYAKGIYKYPQSRFPYEKLTDTNRSRSRFEPEFELADAGAFDENDYFDCQIEYAKESPDDILMKLTVFNRSSRPAVLHLLPQLWFHNSWVWGCTHEGCSAKPRMKLIYPENEPSGVVFCDHETLGHLEFRVQSEQDLDKPEWLFTENETNTIRHPGALSSGSHFKDAFHEYIIQGDKSKVNPKPFGTKCGAHFMTIVHPNRPTVLRCRLTSSGDKDRLHAIPVIGGKASENYTPLATIDNRFDEIFAKRKKEADEYYQACIPEELNQDEKTVARQAYAGLIWTKQFYYYVVDAWMQGDPEGKQLPASRFQGRNADWKHLFNRDVISMPDKWEYPWYAAWDLAFHMIPMSRIDPDFAKAQLLLFLRATSILPFMLGHAGKFTSNLAIASSSLEPSRNYC